MKVDVKGMAEAKAKLAGVRARLLNLTPVLNVIVEDLRKLTADSFRFYDAPATRTPWAPLKPKTIIAKAKRGKTRILVGDTGRLSTQISTAVNQAEGSVLIGSNIPYAGAHQLGTSKIPARPFLPSGEWEPGTRQYRSMLKIVSRVKNYVLNGKVLPLKEGPNVY